ncbi:fluoride efflux transporter CrcB [Gordonibacter sp. Marseille-P4307]|uniref:fluoride efflux transporter CrcB n=1 Tax=Gordonibacter sp. Marseille-P4307 TaxID=2161815 RepID=UPI001F154B53|nr:fluoride efflux transporter CrcB [Gordonibacter sp. Marseille-P4307]
MIVNVIAVAAGGAVGAALRYLASLGVGCLGGSPAIWGSFPLPTFLVNAAGCFLMGVLSAAFQQGGAPNASTWKLFATTGVMGGFTTFSTFSLETLSLIDGGAWGEAALYSLGSLACCLVGVAVGRLAGRALF